VPDGYSIHNHEGFVKFDAGQGTRSQWAWIMVYLVISQFYGPTFFILYGGNSNFDIHPVDLARMSMLYTLLYGIGTLGDFVVVGKCCSETRSA